MKARSPLVLLAVSLLVALAGAACGDDDGGGGSASGGAGAGGGGEPVTLRLGFFPNVTHAPALVGTQGDIFEKALGDNVTLETNVFNAGPEAVEAIFSGALDATYIGPSPAISAYTQSNGEAIRIVSGAASGGAYLVVQPDIDSASDLRGQTVASPQLGNTQDVALRAWLADEGLETDTAGGGDVSIAPQENSQSLETFQAGDIAGAWVPEPWATRLVDEGGGKILVDERDLWPDGQYVTTHIVVRTEFLNDHPDVVKQLLEGTADAIDLISDRPAEARDLVSQSIEELTDKPIPPELVEASFENIEFTNDPIASSLYESAADAVELGLADSDDLDGIYELDLVNEVLSERGDEEVSAS